MNTRTAYRIARKCRGATGWGRRALVTVRLPLSLTDGPCPEPPDLGESGPFEGYFTKQLTDGTFKNSTISHWSGPKEANPNEQRFFVTEREYSDDYVDFWTGEWFISTKSPDDEAFDSVTDVTGRGLLTEAEVGAYKQHRDWNRRNIHGSHSWGYGQKPTQNPVLYAFHCAANAAKTTYGHVEGESILLTYSVKFHYLRWFARDLSRAMKIAKKAGVKVRVFRG